MRAAFQLKTKQIKFQKIKTKPSYKGHRYPTEIIEEAVWLYFNFALSFREVEMMLARRGIEVSYESIRQWCLKFGQTFANEVRCPRPGFEPWCGMSCESITIANKIGQNLLQSYEALSAKGSSGLSWPAAATSPQVWC
jgi:hypothetical protein